ncbi:MAG: sterol-binding protein [Chloroflexi bacterium]|nr:MAG: sterol-binding protein [Chloroflexota bacterium]
MTISEELTKIFEKMPQALVPEAAAGMDAVIQLNLSGDGGGDWSLTIADGAVDIKEEQADSPDLTLGMEAADYVALTKGEANATTLFMTGRIQVGGNIMLAMKFQELFDRSRVE